MHVGSRDIARPRSARPVDGTTRVFITKLGKDLSLAIDDQPVVTETATGSLSELDVDGDLYLGGVKASMYTDLPVGLLRVMNGFHGCLYDVTLNGDLIGDASDGVNVDECDQGACDSSPCRNGATCTNTVDGSFECTCARGWRGYACDVRVDCLMDWNTTARQWDEKTGYVCDGGLFSFLELYHQRLECFCFRFRSEGYSFLW